jgi:nicotinamidase-related amidase
MMTKKLTIVFILAFAFAACTPKKNENKEKMGQKKTQDAQASENGKTALLIIDIQNDYFPGGTMELVSADETAEKAAQMLKYFRDMQLPVIHIQHIALQEGATFFLPNTPGAEINKSVRPLAGEKIITKNYPNSFRDTELLEWLKHNNISNLVICGMMTDVCVDATTRAAMDFGFHNTIITDAVTTRDRDLNGEVIPAGQITKAYVAGLNALGGLYAKVSTSEQYLKQK